jgi:hypothetical protein
VARPVGKGREAAATDSWKTPNCMTIERMPHCSVKGPIKLKWPWAGPEQNNIRERQEQIMSRYSIIAARDVDKS